MADTLLQTISCCCCGKVLGKSLPGTRTYVTCDTCKAEWYYEIDAKDYSVKMTIMKEPKNPPRIPERQFNISKEGVNSA